MQCPYCKRTNTRVVQTLRGRQKLPVYKNGLYYSTSKRYFRAPKTRGGGISMSSMLRHNDLGGWF